MVSRKSDTTKRNGCNKYIVGGIIIVVVFITYYLSPRDSEWVVYPREWKMTEDDVPVASKSSFTYMTYNILCDGMMRADRQSFMYCDSDFLNLNIRQSRLLKEVETANPDILCVQPSTYKEQYLEQEITHLFNKEIDKKWYQNFWYPNLSLRGYGGVDGLTDVKNNFTAGQAIFWKEDVFRRTMHEHHLFHELLKPFIERSVTGPQAEEMYQFYTRRNLLLLAELEEKSSGSRVMVGCPHFAHRKKLEPSVQVLHAGLSLQYLKKLSDRRGTQAMIFSGDLNSPPDHPAYQFIKEGKLSESIKQNIMDKTDFEKLDNDLTKYTIEVLKLVPDVFQHDVKLRSAYADAMGYEPIATEMGGTTTDYVWFTDDHLVVSGVLKIPDEFDTNVIPSSRGRCSRLFASDHMPLVAKISFRH